MLIEVRKRLRALAASKERRVLKEQRLFVVHRLVQEHKASRVHRVLLEP
jgi:hypothetical protein